MDALRMDRRGSWDCTRECTRECTRGEDNVGRARNVCGLMTHKRSIRGRFSFFLSFSRKSKSWGGRGTGDAESTTGRERLAPCTVYLPAAVRAPYRGECTGSAIKKWEFHKGWNGMYDVESDTVRNAPRLGMTPTLTGMDILWTPVLIARLGITGWMMTRGNREDGMQRMRVCRYQRAMRVAG